MLDDGVMLLGRTTWQLFSRLWPGREVLRALMAEGLVDAYRLSGAGCGLSR
ncbi:MULTISPECIES: hypothetical protein [unclassified Nonomuraea]|uniref:hypothetical protein n=1 Tax=unclassified Nonomuraea TaxID=2593643 RepID=UPI0033DCE8EA